MRFILTSKDTNKREEQLLDQRTTVINGNMVLDGITTINGNLLVKGNIFCESGHIFKLEVKGSIVANDINVGDLVANGISAWDINAYTITSCDIEAYFVLCQKLIQKEGSKLIVKLVVEGRRQYPQHEMAKNEIHIRKE